MQLTNKKNGIVIVILATLTSLFMWFLLSERDSVTTGIEKPANFDNGVVVSSTKANHR